MMSKRIQEIVSICWPTRWACSEFNTVECRGRVIVSRCFKNFCCMGVKQDMQVRTIDVVRSNVGSGRAATCPIADAALNPSNANLFHEIRTIRIMQHEAAYSVSSIHVSLEGKLG